MEIEPVVVAVVLALVSFVLVYFVHLSNMKKKVSSSSSSSSLSSDGKKEAGKKAGAKGGKKSGSEEGEGEGDEGSEGAASVKGGGGKDHGKTGKGGKSGGGKGQEGALLLATLKGHTDDVTDTCFEPDGLHIMSSALDRTLRRWPLSAIRAKEHTCARTGVELDNASLLRFSADGKVLAIGLGGARVMRVYVCKDTTIVEKVSALPAKAPSMQALVGAAVAASVRLKYIMTCYRDNLLVLWSFKGEELARIDTKMGTHNYANSSPCGRFVACCGFTTDLRIWEVVPSKEGDTIQLKRAMELQSLDASVVHFAFTPDSHILASVCADGSWHVHNIDVRFELQQPAVLLGKGKGGTTPSLPSPSLISPSPDGLVVALARGRSVEVLGVLSGQRLALIEEAHTKPLVALSFDSTGTMLLSGGERTVKVWGAIHAILSSVERLEKSLVGTSDLARERIETQIASLRSKLREWGAGTA